MKTSTKTSLRFLLCLTAVTLAATPLLSQNLPAKTLLTRLQKGGYVIVMRHASSPRQVPDKQAANPDNLKLERQLDEAGRAGARAMGTALRSLRIPVGEVLSSPTYRAMETARLAQLPNVRTQEELGDTGQSMQSVSAAQGQWLRDRVNRLPGDGTNTILVTHSPNITSAFPDWGAVADGESVVIGRDEKGNVGPLGRIRIEEWSTAAR